MEEDILEDIIVGFVRHQFDVLVCTTIIESGIDIPNVNTIIVDDADRFGLTQLYQLRGRVGRGSHRAYAYLLHKPHKALSEVAEARLDAIQEATELGAGLKVALRDMEIRGAGNVLGAEQSGNIAAVGYDLYIRLLSQAVEEIRQGYPMAEETPLTLDLPLTALIPASYVADVELRLNTYRRVAAVRTLAELAAMREELLDRFGPIPDEVERLLALIRLRIRAEELGIQSLVEREREIVIRPINGGALRKTRLPARLGSALRITPNSVRIRTTELETSWEDALESVISAIESNQRS
jgi:transcription-repair coupling factor (superfamily II helicase)